MIHHYRLVKPRPLDMAFQLQCDSSWKTVNTDPPSLNPNVVEALTYDLSLIRFFLALFSRSLMLRQTICCPL